MLTGQWRRGRRSSPSTRRLFVVILGVLLSFGWTVILVWVVLGLIGLTT